MRIYKHYKGGSYLLISAAIHTETNEELVIYKDAKGKVFARPQDMFFGKVTVDGEEVNRFQILNL